MVLKQKRTICTAAFCLITAASVLMICSMNSWLYPLNPWNDVHIFMTVARAMRDGMLPYRDLMEQKGPLLYFLHVIGLWISPEDYHGMFVVEALLMAGTLFCFHKTARLYSERISVGWTALIAMAICASKTFRYGDCAEELCLLPMAWSMYAVLKSWKTQTPLSGRGYVLHGFLAGCILWIKFNQLGFHFVWMGFQAIEALIRGRGLKRPLKMCLCFLGGMALASAPWLVYFGANGALKDLWEIYFMANIGGYGPRNHNFVLYTGAGLLRGLKDLRLSVPLLMAAAGILFMPRGRMPAKEKLFLMLAAAVMAVAIYGSGLRYVYYFLSFSLFLPFAAAALDGAIRRVAGKRLSAGRVPEAAVCLVMLIVGICGARLLSPNAAWISFPYKETAQGQAAELLGGEEEITLLNAADFDNGFYYALDADPPIRWFTLLNIRREECLADQTACLEAGAVEYAITSSAAQEILDIPENYRLIGEVQSPYGGVGAVYGIWKKESVQP